MTGVEALAGKEQGGLIPLPQTMDEAWPIFSSTIIECSYVPEEKYLFPLDQSILEELGLTSVQMNDARETLGNKHEIEIPPEPDRDKWPKTVGEWFIRYLGFTPAIEDYRAHPDHELFSRQA